MQQDYVRKIFVSAVSAISEIAADDELCVGGTHPVAHKTIHGPFTGVRVQVRLVGLQFLYS